MPVKMTKKDINDLLVAERAKSRLKHQQSAFMRRSLSIYNGQKKRFYEMHDKHAIFPYLLIDLRERMQAALERGICDYCKGKLTVKNITPDHKESLSSGGGWSLSNLVMCDRSCNWQKGRLTEEEFRDLLKFLRMYLSPESQADVKKRLSLGGKWSPK